jgi:hypothetical protein
VRTTGIRVVEDEEQIHRPLGLRLVGKSPVPNQKQGVHDTPLRFTSPKQSRGHDARGVYVSREQFGDKWPFTVDGGYVESINNGNAFGVTYGAVVFHANNGKTYALNGFAMGRGYLDIEPIWRDDPNHLGLKISVGPLIDIGIESRRSPAPWSRSSSSSPPAY